MSSGSNLQRGCLGGHLPQMYCMSNRIDIYVYSNAPLRSGLSQHGRITPVVMILSLDLCLHQPTSRVFSTQFPFPSHPAFLICSPLRYYNERLSLWGRGCCDSGGGVFLAHPDSNLREVWLVFSLYCRFVRRL